MESARHLTWKLLNPSFNATDEHTVLPPHPLDLYVPSYRLIRRVGYGFLGIDVSIYLTGLALLFGLYKAGRYVYYQIYWLFYRNFTSIVFINESDDLFDMLMRWFAENQHNASDHRSMFAVTQYSSRGQDGYEDGDDEDALGESGLFNYDKWSARIPPRFEHGYGRRSFTHNGTWFWFDRRRKSEDQRGPVVVNNSGQDKDEQIQLDCLGRSIEPIKEFLSVVRLWNSSQRRNNTSIRHPASKERRRWGGMAWIRTTSRPSRPISTVILDEAQKHKTIEDMNTFLHPSSPPWYAARGIPYRRGYLFHGPPGTGKTSMTFALAGIFGLDIYAISLQDPSLDESDLLQLFNHLPRRCIVLLEDVDAAGLVRDTSEDVAAKKMKKKKKKEQKKQDDKDNKLDIKAKDNKKSGHTMQTRGAKKNDKKDDEFTLKDLAQEMKSLVSNPLPYGPEPGRRKGRMKRGGGDLDESSNGGGVSLSGLLNAIDGVASPEGQLLIMTTNHPDKLDHALVRPGRVDLRIGFTLAAREELRELFIRMYTPGEETLDAIESSKALQGLKESSGYVGGSTKTNGHSELAKKAPISHPRDADDEDGLGDMSQERLEELADEFAAKIPDNTLTPAEVQNLLMQYKTQPSKAVDRVESWLEEIFEEKEKQRIAEAEKSDTDDEDDEDEVDEDDEW